MLSTTCSFPRRPSRIRRPRISRDALTLTLLATLVLAAPLAAQRLKLPKKLEELEKIARADSNDAVAQYNVAIGYWSKERYDEAEQALRVAVQIDPRLAEAYLAIAYLPFARRPELWEEINSDKIPDEWKAALQESDRLYKRAFLINPLVEMTIVGAVTPPNDALLAHDDEVRKWYERWYDGLEEFLYGRYDKAHTQIHALIRHLNWDRDPDRQPDYVFWFHGLAAAHIDRYDEAIEDLKTLLRRSMQRELRDPLVYVPPRTNEYRYLVAAFQHRAGLLQEAVRGYREALQHDPGLSMAHVGIAEIYEEVGHWRQAIEERRRAAAANPDDPSLLFDVGLALARAGRGPEAIETLTQARDANPRDVRPLYVLGLVQTDLNNTPEARAAFTRFVQLAPSRYEAHIADAKKRIESLP